MVRENEHGLDHGLIKREKCKIGDPCLSIANKVKGNLVNTSFRVGDKVFYVLLVFYFEHLLCCFIPKERIYIYWSSEAAPPRPTYLLFHCVPTLPSILMLKFPNCGVTAKQRAVLVPSDTKKYIPV